MKKLGRGILLLGVSLVLVIVPALHAADTNAADTYAAIAYDESTHTWAYHNGVATKEEAIAQALRKCGHSQAKTNWCRNSWIALAVSSTHGWGSAWAVTPQDARKKSIDECFAHENNPDAHIVICVHSDGRIDTVTNSH
jgi:hypothetical protein